MSEPGIPERWQDPFAILGVPPGPLVGKAWAHLKEVRLEQGPLSREAAEAELRRWWATQSGKSTT